jgi:hypothetical protein
MSNDDTHVHSPAGIRLVVGLIAPFLTPMGKREVEMCWSTPVDVLFKESLDLAAEMTTHPTLHAALGVWTRNHTVPAEAAALLNAYLKALPSSTIEAQKVLDAWAEENTFGMIPQFPCEVQEDTHAVLASALAIEDTWERKGREIGLGFNGQRVDGFEALADDTHALSTSERDAVRVTLPLASGLLMNFCIAADLNRAQSLLMTPNLFTEAVVDGQDFVTTQKVKRETTDVAALLPVFTTRTSLNLGESAANWGIVEAMRPHGVPGLGDLEVTEAKQDAFIEVTHTGVRAAAVTAMMMTRSAASFAPPQFDQRVVTFDRPFVYEIVLPGHRTPLFLGSYAG